MGAESTLFLPGRDNKARASSQSWRQDCNCTQFDRSFIKVNNQPFWSVKK